MVSKLASSDKIETIDDLLEAASDWAADQEEQRKSQAQRVETLRAKKKRKLEDLHPLVHRTHPWLSLVQG